MLATPDVEHLVRFVYEGATDSDPMAGKEDEIRTADGVLLSELLETGSEPEEEEVAAGQVQVRVGSVRLTGKSKKRTLSVITNKRITKKGVKAKGAASRLIARAIEGSEAECRLIRMVRRLALKQVSPRINKVVLSVPGSPKRPHLAFPFGQAECRWSTHLLQGASPQCALSRQPLMSTRMQQWGIRWAHRRSTQLCHLSRRPCNFVIK